MRKATKRRDSSLRASDDRARRIAGRYNSWGVATAEGEKPATGRTTFIATFSAREFRVPAVPSSMSNPRDGTILLDLGRNGANDIPPPNPHLWQN